MGCIYWLNGIFWIKYHSAGKPSPNPLGDNWQEAEDLKETSLERTAYKKFLMSRLQKQLQPALEKNKVMGISSATH